MRRASGGRGGGGRHGVQGLPGEGRSSPETWNLPRSLPPVFTLRGKHSKGFVLVRDLQWPSHAVAVAQWRLGAAAGERRGPGWVSASAPVPVVRPVLRGDRPLAFVDPAQVLWWSSKPRHSQLNSLLGGERGAGDVGAGEVVAHGGGGSHHGDHRCRVRPRGTGAVADRAPSTMLVFTGPIDAYYASLGLSSSTARCASRRSTTSRRAGSTRRRCR